VDFILYLVDLKLFDVLPNCSSFSLDFAIELGANFFSDYFLISYPELSFFDGLD